MNRNHQQTNRLFYHVQF